MENSKSILLVDDQPLVVSALRDALLLRGWDAVMTDSPVEAMRILNERHFDIILTDYRMSEMNGIELIKKALPAAAGATFLIMSGTVDERLWHFSMECRIELLLKPISLEALLERISR